MVKEIVNTPYGYDETHEPAFREIADRVKAMRDQGTLSPDVLYRIRKHFRIKNIYHSNAIEGNALAVGETRQVVELGLTITGKSLKDQAEARNLSHALDFLEDLASNSTQPIRETDIRQLHTLVLSGLNDEAGSYRSVPVTISGSSYPPPGPETVASQMEDFCRWLSLTSVPTDEAFASVAGLLIACAAHTWFVTIHPFIDGNGRVARLLLNLLLMRYRFPIAIISKEDRLRYYDALEESQGSDLTPFAVLLAECIEESLEEYELAAEEQREHTEWTQTIAEKFTQPERVRVENEYEVWKNAMELLKSYLRQTVNKIDEQSHYGNIFFSDYGNLEFEKYSALRSGVSAKRTWFFRIDFRRADKRVRYLFFFGHASNQMRERCQVSLHVAREDPPNSFNYERLDNISAPNVPSLTEIGYEIAKERFVIRKRAGRPSLSRVEDFGIQFFDDVFNKHFTN